MNASPFPFLRLQKETRNMSFWSNWLGRRFGKGKIRKPARRRLLVEPLEERLVPYSSCGGTWPQPGGLGTPVNVTYSYPNLFDGGMVGVSNFTMLQAVEEALSLWARYAPFTFREVSSGTITISHGPLDGTTVGLTSCPGVGFTDPMRLCGERGGLGV
jgi:hypothetical protein